MMNHYNTSEHTQNTRNLVQVENQIDTSPVVQIPLYLGLILTIGVVPLFIHSQWVTGVLVNFILIFTCLKLGIRAALPLTFVPSIAAVISGLFPLALAAMIPFIMAGNILLILVIHYFKYNYLVALSIAAFAKFAFLYSASHFLAQYFLPETFLDKVMLMMSWPQFATAMVGGLFAALVVNGLSFTGK